MVEQACKELPPNVQRLLRNVAVTVEDEPPPDVLLDGGALGLYQGVPIGERGASYTMVLPDKITVYRLPLLAECGSMRELEHEIRLTILHEVGHYFGLGEDDIPF
jgi:predicted Zn-dependent protease with MMP-like domain